MKFFVSGQFNNLNLINRRSSLDQYSLGAVNNFTNDSKTFQCYQCNRSYKYLRNLKYHMSRECGFQPPFKCSYCEYRSTRKCHLKSHIYSKHGHIKEFSWFYVYKKTDDNFQLPLVTILKWNEDDNNKWSKIMVSQGINFNSLLLLKLII